jgi:hypothetical protein
MQQAALLCVKLRVINDSDMVLTTPGVRSTVNSYKSIIYTADQVHPRGEKGWLDDDHDQALRGAL